MFVYCRSCWIRVMTGPKRDAQTCSQRLRAGSAYRCCYHPTVLWLFGRWLRRLGIVAGRPGSDRHHDFAVRWSAK